MSRLVTAVSFALLAVACGGGPVFSEERTQRSKEMYGRQQQSGENISRTSADQSEKRHEDATKPVQQDPDENSRK